MTSILVAALVQAAILAVPEQTYWDAYQRSAATGRPLVVLLGADWCPACVKMKRSILPEVSRLGGMQHVEFAYVDVDHQRDLAAKLSRAPSIPQLICFERQGDGWSQRLLLGAHPAQKVTAFLGGEAVRERPTHRWAGILTNFTEFITGKRAE